MIFNRSYKDTNNGDKRKIRQYKFFVANTDYSPENRMMIYTYDHDNSGKNCLGKNAEGARCDQIFSIGEDGGI